MANYHSELKKPKLEEHIVDPHIKIKVCQDEETHIFSISKANLRRISDVFSSMFDGEWDENQRDELLMKDSNVTVHAIQNLSNFCNATELLLNLSNPFDTLYIARKYFISGLADKTIQQLINATDASNCLDFLPQAILYESSALISECLSIIGEDILRIMKTEGWLRIERECLEKILGSDELCCLEVDLFNGLIRWAKANTFGSGIAEESHGTESVLGETSDKGRKLHTPVGTPECIELTNKKEKVSVFTFLNEANQALTSLTAESGTGLPCQSESNEPSAIPTDSDRELLSRSVLNRALSIPATPRDCGEISSVAEDSGAAFTILNELDKKSPNDLPSYGAPTIHKESDTISPSVSESEGAITITRESDTKPPTDQETIRNVLSNLIYLIRFPNMIIEEFDESVLPENVLSHEEVHSLRTCILNSNTPAPWPFVKKRRLDPPFDTTKCTKLRVGHGQNEKQDKLVTLDVKTTFYADRPILFHGVQLPYFHMKNGFAETHLYSMTVKCEESIVYEESYVSIDQEGHALIAGLIHPVRIQPGKTYEVRSLGNRARQHQYFQCSHYPKKAYVNEDDNLGEIVMNGTTITIIKQHDVKQEKRKFNPEGDYFYISEHPGIFCSSNSN